MKRFESSLVTRTLAAAVCACLLWAAVGCNDDVNDPRAPYMPPLDPHLDAAAIFDVLGIDGQLRAGPSPVPSGGPTIAAHQPTASITANNTLFLPVYHTSQTAPVAGMYLEMQGAPGHWDIPLAGSGLEGTHVVPIGIPSFVMAGPVSLEFRLYDAEGNVGEPAATDVEIVATIVAQGGSRVFPVVSGNDGLTVRSFDVGSEAGQISIVWTTYTIPDRIDVRFNGQWVRSTGTTLDQLRAPPILRCADAAGADGFIGSSDIFTIDHPGGSAGALDVYVSGCMGGGTAWQFQVAFLAEESAYSWYDDLPPCPCRYDAIPWNAVVNSPSGRPGVWQSSDGLLSIFHPGAAHGVRWQPNDGGSGQQCTYSADGRLITGGAAAGTADQISPSDFIGHFGVDVWPWFRSPCHEYFARWPANDGGCGGNEVYPFRHMSDLVGNMTCAEIVVLTDAVRMYGSQALIAYFQGTYGSALSREQLISELRNLRGRLMTAPGSAGLPAVDEVDAAIANLSARS
ncbi:MAG: hypothetical protein IPK64_18370 [bacterium]|nr:hypothetical protein [bacterium]